MIPPVDERECSICLTTIAPEDWDDRHDIGLEIAHARCCCGPRLPFSMRNPRAV